MAGEKEPRTFWRKINNLLKPKLEPNVVNKISYMINTTRDRIDNPSDKLDLLVKSFTNIFDTPKGPNYDSDFKTYIENFINTNITSSLLI